MTGAALRKARKSRNLSTQMVADLIGVHRNTVIRWEKGAVLIPGPAHASLRWILNASAPIPSEKPPKRSRKRAPRLNVQNGKGA